MNTDTLTISSKDPRVISPELIELTKDRDNKLVLANSTIEQAPNSRRYRLPGDAVFKGTAKLPDEQKGMLRWLHHHLDQIDRPIKEIAPFIKKEDGKPYSDDSLYQALTGRRDADSAKICAAIAKYREYVEREEATIKTGFIATSLYGRVLDAYQRALRRHRVVFIFGNSQIGKTTNLEEIARTHNHGQTILVRMPTGGSLALLLVEFALVLGISPHHRIKDLRRRIIESFDPTMMLIVDECHQCLRDTCSERAVHSLEFIREIIDRRKCGALLCGTNEFHKAITGGRSKGILAQLWRRMLSPVYLPDHPSDRDLATFAKAYGLGPAPQRKITATIPNSGDERTIAAVPYELQTEIAHADGLGRWIAILQEAADMAADQKRQITWGHVLIAHDSFTQMERQ